MAKVYLEKLRFLMAELAPYMSTTASLEIKHFFSGAAVYADEHICITFTPAGFAMKLPEGSRNKLVKEKGAKSLQYFPGAPTKKEYVILPPSVVDDREMLSFWVGKSIEYVLTKPERRSK